MAVEADGVWRYSAKATLPVGVAIAIEVTARDFANNQVTQSLAWAPT